MYSVENVNNGSTVETCYDSISGSKENICDKRKYKEHTRFVHGVQPILPTSPTAE